MSEQSSTGWKPLVPGGTDRLQAHAAMNERVMTMSSAVINVHLERPIGVISKHIYGHFAEHLGRCIEEGIWVGEESSIPNEAGVRKDMVAALRAIRAPIVRWPGGCFADAYDWRDGIGPRDQRPRRLNVWWDKEEDNHFGTDEFVQFCRMIGAQPYICGNVGSGSPREMMQWLEYCNYAGNTTLAQERAANGSAEPYRIKYWGIGNENYGCGGAYDAAAYAREYRRYASYLRRMDPTVELIACGHSHEWNLEFLENIGRLDTLDHLSLHHYYGSGPARGFSTDEYYGLFPKALELEGRIVRDAELLDFFERGAGRIKLAIDEWGVWHPEANPSSDHYQENTLRDAVCAAVLFDVFNRHCNVISMTNIAQIVNVLQCLIQTAAEKMWLTPTYHVYNMYQPHMNARAVEAEVECSTLDLTHDGKPYSLPTLSASASVGQDKESVCVTFSNVHLRNEMEVTVRFRGVERLGSGRVRVLTARKADAVNGPDAPDAVAPQRGKLRRRGNTVVCTIPPHSMAALMVKL